MLKFLSALIHLGKSTGSQDHGFRPFGGTVPDGLRGRRRRQYDDRLIDIFRQILDRRIHPVPQNFAALGIDQIQLTFEFIGQNVLNDVIAGFVGGTGGADDSDALRFEKFC